MDCTRQVYWHEGLFLRPHHFQQQALHHQSSLGDVLGLVRPFPWGVVSQEVAEAALSNQVFEIQKGEWVFPDGALVRLPGNARLAPRSFEGLWDPAAGAMPVYLGLKKLSPGARNAAGAGESRTREGTRFWVSDDPTPTHDLFAAGREEPLLYLDYDLFLFFGDEVNRAADYGRLKIAEVQRYGNEVRLAEGFVPPSLDVGSSPLLSRMLRELREKLTARALELALYKQEQRRGAIDLGSRDFVYFVGLMMLNRWVPLLHHLTEGSPVSPWAVYGALRQLAGELSTLSSRRDVLGRLAGTSPAEGLPPYGHESLGPCFEAASRVVCDILDEMVAGPDCVVELHFDGTYYFAELSSRVFEGNNRFFLSVRTDLPQEEVIYALRSTAKLSAREYLPIVIARSLPGVPVEHLPSAPPELPRRADTVYFALDPVGAPWEALRNGLNVAIYFDRPPGAVEIALLVIYGK
jgi:type VI secretion system protein ImpJ